MIGLTPKQRALYDFMAAEISAKGIAPSYAEITTHFGFGSKSQVYQLMNALEARGVVRRGKGAREIELVQSAVTLNTEILALADKYAASQGISRDTAVNEALREWFGAAA